MVYKFDVEFMGEPAGWLAWDDAAEAWSGEIEGPTEIGNLSPEDWVGLVSEAVAIEMSNGPYFAGRWNGWTWGPAAQ